jgi:hypothetical protein
VPFFFACETTIMCGPQAHTLISTMRGARSVDTTNKVVTFESVYEERETDEEVPVHPAASIKYDELGMCQWQSCALYEWAWAMCACCICVAGSHFCLRHDAVIAVGAAPNTFGSVISLARPLSLVASIPSLCYLRPFRPQSARR